MPSNKRSRNGLQLSVNITCMLLIGLLLMTTVVHAREQGDQEKWELIRSEEGIDTYRMTLPDTNVCMFKGVGFVDAGIEVISEVVRDIPSYPRWVAACKEARVVKEINRNTIILYNILDVPFPYHNRDVLIASKGIYNLENGTAEILFGGIEDPDLMPENDKYVRLPLLKGRYYFEYFGRHMTRVTYIYMSHPGGNIPLTIANWSELQYYPQINIKGLRKMVKQAKYIEAGRNSPEYDLVERLVASRPDVAKVLKNRSAEFFFDPVLLDLLFDQPMVQAIIDDVHARHTTYESVVDGVTGIFFGFMEMDDAPRITAYLKDKSLDQVFSMERLMREKWLLHALAKDKSLIDHVMNPGSAMARMVYEKITTSPSALALLMDDKQLAEDILADAELREQLWTDSALKQTLKDQYDSLKTLKDVETILKDRVEAIANVHAPSGTSADVYGRIP
ncbi:MAG: START domain-containing protein [Thermodesulfobacteriota bacterium]|nr:START domain-containing protein [Thermodesulfobacteriota bacterium]